MANFNRRYVAAAMLLCLALPVGGCKKKQAAPDASATEETTASTAVADTAVASADSTPSATATAPTPAKPKLAHGRRPNGACLDGFMPLVQPPGSASDPCYKSCTANKDCTGGEICSGEESFAGHRMVCEPPSGKATASKCKPNEVLAINTGTCLKECLNNNGCTSNQQCAPLTYNDASGAVVTSRGCYVANSPAALAAFGGDTKPTGYKVGDKLTVEWKGGSYPATIIGVPAANQYKIHYDGYGNNWDEVIGPSRIRGKR